MIGSLAYLPQAHHEPLFQALPLVTAASHSKTPAGRAQPTRVPVLLQGQTPALPWPRHTHYLLRPVLGSLGVHLQGGKLGGPLLPGLKMGSESLPPSLLSLPGDLTLGLGHWYKHLGHQRPAASLGVGTRASSPAFLGLAPYLERAGQDATAS